MVTDYFIGSVSIVLFANALVHLVSKAPENLTIRLTHNRIIFHKKRLVKSKVRKLYKELKEKEVLHSEKTKIETTYYGTREFSTLDLHGNLLTFYENIE